MINSAQGKQRFAVCATGSRINLWTLFTGLCHILVTGSGIGTSGDGGWTTLISLYFGFGVIGHFILVSGSGSVSKSGWNADWGASNKFFTN